MRVTWKWRWCSSLREAFFEDDGRVGSPQGIRSASALGPQPTRARLKDPALKNANLSEVALLLISHDAREVRFERVTG